VSEGRHGQKEKEQVQSSQKNYSQWSSLLMFVVVVDFHHKPLVLGFLTADLALLLAHIADGNTKKDYQQDAAAENPVRRTETEHAQLLLNASAASFIKPIS
jgi:hypothetical protein